MGFVLTVAMVGAGLVALGVVYQWIGAARDARRFPAPGRRVDVGGHRIHIHVAGEQTKNAATVILESGVAASSPSWRLVQPRIAEFARVVTYDRAGLGWSDPCASPITAEQILRDLRAALACAGVAPPYIFVGHSFGGLVARLYAARYRGELAGVVLLDPPHPGEWHPDVPESKRVMLRHGARLSRRGAWCARLGINRLLLSLLTAGMRRGPRAFVAAVSGRGVTIANRIVGEIRKLPPETHPVLKSLWSQPKCFASMAAHLEALPEMCGRVAAESRTLGDLPLVVLTASNPTPERLLHQEEVAALSTRGRHLIVANSGHWIQLDQPELVVELIRQMAEGSR